ncbi:MAG: hypothetical protein R6V50_07090 [Thermoplasmatota archaeon]
MKNLTIQFLQIGNIVAAIATIIVNALANILPIGGKYTAEISDNIPNLFVPTGITFSIWGFIYMLIMVFTLYLASDIFSKEKKNTIFIEKISLFFIIASLANILWIFLWHYEYVVLSFGAMAVLFLCLLLLYLRLNIARETLPFRQKICVHLPISVYFGWITVATIANVTAALVVSSWNGFGFSESLWTILIIVVATLIAILVVYMRKDYAYGGVFMWAFFGIYLKRIGDDQLYGVQSAIAYTAAVSLAVIFITITVVFYLSSLKKKK